MATAVNASIAAGIYPLTTRRDAAPRISSIFKSKLSVSASAVRTEKQPALSVSDNGAVEKKQRPPPPSSAALEERRSTLRDYFELSRELISRSDGGPPRWLSPLECRSPLKDSPLLLYLPGFLI